MVVRLFVYFCFQYFSEEVSRLVNTSWEPTEQVWTRLAWWRDVCQGGSRLLQKSPSSTKKSEQLTVWVYLQRHLRRAEASEGRTPWSLVSSLRTSGRPERALSPEFWPLECCRRQKAGFIDPDCQADLIRLKPTSYQSNHFTCSLISFSSGLSESDLQKQHDGELKSLFKKCEEEDENNNTWNTNTSHGGHVGFKVNIWNMFKLCRHSNTQTSKALVKKTKRYMTSVESNYEHLVSASF